MPDRPFFQITTSHWFLLAEMEGEMFITLTHLTVNHVPRIADCWFPRSNGWRKVTAGCIPHLYSLYSMYGLWNLYELNCSYIQYRSIPEKGPHWVSNSHGIKLNQALAAPNLRTSKRYAWLGAVPPCTRKHLGTKNIFTGGFRTVWSLTSKSTS